MNQRQNELLRILLTQDDEAFLIHNLSNQLHCSEKTIRNDLKRIEELIRENSAAILVRKPGIGIYLEADAAERSRLFQLLFSQETLKSNEERRMEIAYKLLISDTPHTLDELAKHYYVTKKNIKQDIENITEWLKRFDLQLLSKQGLGSTITGTELNKRNALAHLSNLLPVMSHTTNYMLNLFMPYEIDVVRKKLIDVQDRYSLPLTDGALESLLVHALIMIKRIKQKSPIEIPQEELASGYPQKEYQYTEWFLDQLASSFQIVFPYEEKVYFTWHLLSSKKRHDPSLGSDFNNLALKVIQGLTMKLREMTMINFHADPILLNGLAVHMNSVIHRLHYGFPITNPLLYDIKKMYPFIFNMVMLSLEEIKEQFRVSIPEDEAAYLVLHFQAAIERLEGKREIMKRALIVCHMGIGMSHLLQAKMEQHYKDIYVIDCIGKADVSNYLNKHSVDFIISTVPLEKVKIPSIVVSPLLEDEDKDRLNQFFHQLEYKKTGKQQEDIFSRFMDINLIYLNVEKEHRFEVVELLGNALYQKGYVEQSFTHSALVREKSSATSIGAGIAIPHGNPSLIKRSAIAVAVLSTPIEWGNELVSLVFMLGIGDEEKKYSRQVIQYIVSLTDNPSFIQLLTEAKTEEEFLSLL
ncbi:transcription antiterminator [Rossellomorea vietnamensis]|uniref:Transcription antiterminator n=1 Tax=Rossellomorea vietnamensis TaxID=218284 RepID=A0A5D4NUX7_9BACI|nr:BglG family transcription antiterminator [Rossellomorea vietnamensis]TYS17730.1 transcription antiterminator [Rossellomorea vietnamensis]